jgi:hypothetical protein
MEHLPANTGWLWIKEGFALFRKQPMELSTLFLGYMFLMLAVSVIPIVGTVLPLILVPIFSMSFMQACVNIGEGKRVYPSLLLSGFRSAAFGNLLKLGAGYLAAAVLALAASSLIDGGVFWQVMTGQIELDQKTVEQSGMTSAMLFSAALYVPAAMAFWFAAPLVAWQKMGAGKSVFYSFFAVFRARKAFIVYALAWAVIGIILPALFGAGIALITGQLTLARLVLLPISVVMAVIMYCSFYPSYTSIFGKPDLSAPPAA